MALTRQASWVQLGKFCAVGGSGYVVNLAVYTLLLWADIGILTAAVSAFLAAVANNYTLNRRWTFKASGGVVEQGFRYLAVSCATLVASLAALTVLVAAGGHPIAAQAGAIVLVTPLSFLGNKLWSFGR
jgi:dolichol-phosphate mannosyltransferase